MAGFSYSDVILGRILQIVQYQCRKLL